MLNLYGLFNSKTANSATIFMLHAIADPNDPNSSGLSPRLLAKFLEYLKHHDYTVLTLKEYIDALINKQPTNKTVIFTVDGYRDFYLNAYELFRQYNYPVTIFLTSDFIDRKLFFWWDQIEFSLTTTDKKRLELDELPSGSLPLTTEAERSEAITQVTRHCKTLSNDDKLLLLKKLIELLEVDLAGQPAGKYEPLKWSEILEMQENGINFHPHTQTHPIMSKLPSEQKRVEVRQAKERLEEQLGRPADIFCYPNGQWGDFDEEVISELKAAGYIAAVTGMEGFDLTTNETDLFRLRRYPIPNDVIRFKQFVCGLEFFKQSVLGER